MSRSNLERYQQTVAYIKANIDDGLGTDIGTIITDKKKAGKEISLSGAGYNKVGTADQHMAVRALMLCQIAYFRPPPCPVRIRNQGGDLRHAYRL